MERLLAFDVETWGAWDHVPQRLQGYLEGRDRQRGVDPASERGVRQSVSLLPGLARVVAVGLWSAPEERGRALALDPDQPEPRREATTPDGQVTTYQREADLLQAFWAEAAQAAAAGVRLISFNGRGFDGPVLALRSAVLGVPPGLDLCGERRTLRPHCDLEEVLTFFGAAYPRYSLDYWCGVFELESPKGQMNGATVGPAWGQGRREEVARYSIGDARATAQLYQRLAEVVRTLEGGPAQA